MDSVGSPRREQRDEKEKHGKTNPNRRESDVGDEYPVREHREHSRNFRQDDDEEESHLPPVDETTALIVPPEEDWLLTGSDCSGDDDGILKREGVLGLWELVGIIYFATSGGPEGSEGLVSTGGASGALCGIFIMALVFSGPIALMAAELGTTVPENGGSMVWARAAWGAGTIGGDATAFLAGWMSFLFSAVDAALYPSMFVSYLTNGVGIDLSENEQLCIKLLFVSLLVLHNCIGVASVGESSGVMMIILLAPFCVFILGAFTGIPGWPFEASNWTTPAKKPASYDCILLLVWNMGMWESAAVCAGEVRNPGKTYPKALLISVCIVVCNYALPIMAFTAVDGDFSKYENGYYIEVARSVGGSGFAVAMAIGQCVSTLGLFSNSLVKNSYLLCGMGEQTLLPKVFGSRWKRTNAPLFSIAASSVVTLCMVMLSDFEAILGIDMFFYSVVLLIEIASFFKLRHSFPHLPRGYKVPLDGYLLFIFFLPCALLAAFVASQTEKASLLVAGVLVIIGLIEYGCVCVCRRQTPSAFQQMATAVPDLLETPACSRLGTPAPSRLNTPAPSRQGSIVGASPFSSTFNTPCNSSDKEPVWLSALSNL